MDENTGEYEYGPYDPKNDWFNPFTGKREYKPLRELETDEEIEQKKERSKKVSVSRTVSKVYHLARSNAWEWFFTLTFNPEKVDSYSYEETTKRLKSWLDTIRRVNADIKYLLVPELHESGRIHFHGLFAGCDGLDFEDSGKKTPDGETIYNIGRYKLGWSTATRIKDCSRVTSYISKYITKDLIGISPNKKRYWASRNLSDCQALEAIMEYADLKKFKEACLKNCVWSKEIINGENEMIVYEMEVSDETKELLWKKYGA